MHARPILAHEIERFVEAAGDPDHNEDIADYAQKMFAAGSMRPEWCYIVEETERPSGRVALLDAPRHGEATRPGTPRRRLGRS